MFLINVPIAAAGLLCALPLVPDSKNPAARRPDLAGAVLSIAGLGLVLPATPDIMGAAIAPPLMAPAGTIAGTSVTG